jgi:hypothetical protein
MRTSTVWVWGRRAENISTVTSDRKINIFAKGILIKILVLGLFGRWSELRNFLEGIKG